MKKIWWVVVIVSLGLYSIGIADTVYLKSGQKIIGRIIAKDDTGVQVETKLGTMKIKATQIDRIEQVATEDYYLKEGDTLVQKGELEKAIALYQTGFEKTQSPVLKDKIETTKAALAQKIKESDDKQKAEQLTRHLAEYKRLKNRVQGPGKMLEVFRRVAGPGFRETLADTF
ncbi:MAG: hypothetical protein ACE14V_07145, partial [bacterium]